MTHRLGVDVGGTGIKAAAVDTDEGTLVGERHRVLTPQPATVAAVVESIAAVARAVDVAGPVGVALPGVIKQGVVCVAPHLDDEWLGVDAAAVLSPALGRSVTVLNDADAAALAEVRYGAAVGVRGVVVLATFGTGIGTAIVSDGVLVPNTELGHLILDGEEGEELASNRARERDELSWKRWGGRVSAYLRELDRLLWPDLFVLGGGVVKRYDRFEAHLDTRAPVVPARLGNRAGIVGAALAARPDA